MPHFITLALRAMSFVTVAHVCRRGAHSFRLASQRPSFDVPSRDILRPRGSFSINTLVSNNGQLVYRLFPSAITHTRLSEQENINEGWRGNDVQPTWIHVPYHPTTERKPPSTTRKFSNQSFEWVVPDQIPIPEDQLQISFARASGAGGQNVNKVNTKVELRFHLGSASWIPEEVRERLKSNEANRINNEGYMTVTSQEYRTQLQNRKDAMKKLEDILRNSWPRPKVRKIRKGLSSKTKEQRREMKKKISEKKANRRSVDF